MSERPADCKLILESKFTTGRIISTVMSEKRFAATKGLRDALVRMLCGGFLPTIDDGDNWAYVRSWTGSPGEVDVMEIVSVIDGETLEGVRVARDGRTLWGPNRGRPGQLITGFLDFGLSQTASRVMVSGWWWGPETGNAADLGAVHAASPFGPMPETATALCSAPMRCHGPNRPSGVGMSLCPSCCVAVVESVVTAPHKAAPNKLG